MCIALSGTSFLLMSWIKKWTECHKLGGKSAILYYINCIFECRISHKNALHIARQLHTYSIVSVQSKTNKGILSKIVVQQNDFPLLKAKLLLSLWRENICRQTHLRKYVQRNSEYCCKNLSSGYISFTFRPGERFQVKLVQYRMYLIV